MTAEEEHWRPIAGFEGWYEVSNQGRVRGVKRTILRSNGSVYTAKPYILKPTPTGARNQLLRVGLARGGECHNRLVNVLVAEAFGTQETT